MQAKQKVNIIYHSADLDGFCSGAIARKWCMENDHEVEMFPWDYGQDNREILSKIFDTDKVIMTDVSFPWNDMYVLMNLLGGNFVWIDHHKTAIEDSIREGYESVTGIRRVGDSASKLAWEFFYRDKEFREPTVVYFVDRYDVWKQDISDGISWDMVMNAQMGMRLHLSNPKDDKEFESWLSVISQDISMATIIDSGKIINAYEKKTNEIRCNKAAFRLEFEGLKFAAINNVLAGSNVLNSYVSPEDDGLMVFAYSRGGWGVSLYQNVLNPNKVDLSVIAKKYGGGGHAGACGFRVNDIQEIIGTHWTV